MKTNLRKGKGDRGSALVITLLLLVILTVIGIFAFNISTSEFGMATNSKYGKVALYAAQAGAYFGIDRYPTLVDNTTVFPALPNQATYSATSADTGETSLMPGYGASYRYVYFQVTALGHAAAPSVTTRTIVTEAGFGPVPFGPMY